MGIDSGIVLCKYEHKCDPHLLITDVQAIQRYYCENLGDDSAFSRMQLGLSSDNRLTAVEDWAKIALQRGIRTANSLNQLQIKSCGKEEWWDVIISFSMVPHVQFRWNAQASKVSAPLIENLTDRFTDLFRKGSLDLFVADGNSRVGNVVFLYLDSKLYSVPSLGLRLLKTRNTAGGESWIWPLFEQIHPVFTKVWPLEKPYTLKSNSVTGFLKAWDETIFNELGSAKLGACLGPLEVSWEEWKT